MRRSRSTRTRWRSPASSAIARSSRSACSISRWSRSAAAPASAPRRCCGRRSRSPRNSAPGRPGRACSTSAPDSRPHAPSGSRRRASTARRRPRRRRPAFTAIRPTRHSSRRWSRGRGTRSAAPGSGRRRCRRSRALLRPGHGGGAHLAGGAPLTGRRKPADYSLMIHGSSGFGPPGPVTLTTYL